MQVGLPEGFLHDMWMLCNDAQRSIKDQVWLETNADEEAGSKAKVRERTYRALIEYLERQGDQ